MEWTASDIALVISTSATAIAAISGLAVPIWQGIVEKRHARREQTYANASSAIHFCVQHVDQVARYSNHEAMRLAFLKSGNSIPDEEDRRQEQPITMEFEKNLRMAQLIGIEIGVDVDKFLSKAHLVPVLVDRFEFKDGQLVVLSDQQDTASKRHDAVHEFVLEASRLLHAIREKVGLRP